MFSLINSTILISLVALGLPLLIHLLNRQKRQRIPYSSLRFLRFLEKHRIKKISLYQYLLILIRTMIILMLILAFARPVYNNTISISDGRAAITSVIILDNGLNMRGFDNGIRRFDQVMSRLEDLLGFYSGDDRVSILTASDLLKMPLDSIQRDALKCTYILPDFIEGLKIAKKEIESHPNYTKEIHIISDFMSAGNRFYELCQSEKEVDYYFHKIGSGYLNNISIDSLAVLNQILEKEKNISVNIYVQNRGPNVQDDIGVHVYSHDKRMAYQNISLGPFERKTVPLKFRAPGAGLISGYIEIPEDDLIEDNRFFFSIYIPQKISVLFVDDEPSIYIKSALQSIENTTEIQFTYDQFNSWGRQLLSEYDILFLSNLPDLTRQLKQRILKFVNDGGGLIIIPGDRSSKKSLQEVTTEFSQIITIGSRIQSLASENFITLEAPPPDDLLLADLFRSVNADYELPKFYQYFQYNIGPESGMILKFRNQNPFFISGPYKQGFVGVFAAYFDETWTDFPFKGIFSPFISRIIYLGVTHASNKVSWIRSGQDISIEVHSSSGSDFNFTPPEQDPYRVIPLRRSNSLLFSLSDLNIPGNYFLSSAMQTIHIISVNVDHMDLFDMHEMQTGIDSENIHILDTNTPLKSQLDKFRSGIEFTDFFTILTLLMILTELLLVKQMEGRKGKPSINAGA